MRFGFFVLSPRRKNEMAIDENLVDLIVNALEDLYLENKAIRRILKAQGLADY